MHLKSHPSCDKFDVTVLLATVAIPVCYCLINFPNTLFPEASFTTAIYTPPARLLTFKLDILPTQPAMRITSFPSAASIFNVYIVLLASLRLIVKLSLTGLGQIVMSYEFSSRTVFNVAVPSYCFDAVE